MTASRYEVNAVQAVRRLTSGVVSVAVLLTAGAAWADGLKPQSSAGLGVELPFGDLDGDTPTNEAVTFRIPIFVELGAFVDDAWLLGLHGGTGLGKPADECGGEAPAPLEKLRCGFFDLRLAVQAQNYKLLEPIWVGAGLGWEWFSTQPRFAGSLPNPDTGELTDVQFNVEHRRRGPFVMLQAGTDWAVDETLFVGPWVGVLGGRFITERYECQIPDCPTGGSIDKQTFHGWVGGGIRLSFGPRAEL